jgi:hypothetical protein
MAGLLTQGLGGNDGSEGASGFQLQTATGGQNTITLAFTNGFPPTSVTGPSAVPANWTIAPLDGGNPVQVTGIAIVGVDIVLTTTNQSGGKNYELTIPVGIMSNGTAMLGPFVISFLGVATTPTFLQAISIEAHILDLYFSAVPDAGLVLDPTRYSITPGPILVTAVKKVSDTVYRLSTSRQGIGITYTVTWPN